MNSTQIMQSANPIDDTAFADSWADPEGKASFEQIVADDRTTAPAQGSRSRRPVRRRLVIGAAIAAAGGTAVAVVGLPGAQHDGAPSAWSVTKQHNIVTVRVSEYRDPAGLERRLNAAGLRTDVVTVPARCVGMDSGPGSTVNYWVDTDSFPAPQRWWALVGLPADGNSDDGAPHVASGGRHHIALWGVGIGGGAAYHPGTLTARFDVSQLPAGNTVTLAFGGETAERLGMYVMVTPTGHAPSCPAEQQPPKNDPTVPAS